MKKFLTTFFYYWWKPAIIVGIGFLIYVIGGFTYSRFWENVCSLVFGFTLLLLMISFIFQLVRKENGEALYTFFLRRCWTVIEKHAEVVSPDQPHKL